MTQSLFTSIAHQVFPGSSFLGHWPLTGGVSANMYAVELEQPSGEHRCIVIRQHGAATWKSLDKDVTSNEFELLRVLFDEGLEVPEPLYLDRTGSILPSPYLVTEYIDGTTSVPHEVLDKCLQQMALFLSRLHGLDPASISIPDLPTIEDPVTGALEYLPKVGEDKRLLSAIGSMKASTTVRRLLHGDFWPGNILWKNGRLAAVIDWEDATLGDPMSDLACCRVELLCQYGPDAMEAFTDYYLGYDGPDISDLGLWEIYVSAAALATMPNWGLSPDEEDHRRKMTNDFLKESADKLLSQKM